MAKIRGFKLGRRLIRVSRWILRKTRIQTRPGYHRLGGPSRPLAREPVWNILNWGRKFTTVAKSLLRSGSGYVRSESDPVPKGHLAVYVGHEDGDLHRVLVPVIYFNHPLFGELLREAEKEYGFHHQGGITLPCRFTEFERVKTRIASGSSNNCTHPRLAWR